MTLGCHQGALFPSRVGGFTIVLSPTFVYEGF